MASLRSSLLDGVLVAEIDTNEVNLFTVELVRELHELATRVDADDEVRVVVFRSANPDFFIAHFDIEVIIASASSTASAPARVNGFQRLCERWRTLSTPSIAEIDGRVGGGGAEFCASLDIRIGSLERCVINQMEVPLGILPGGSGTQRLPRLLGRGRALELILGADDLDAATAERWGWLNRAVPAAELSAVVDRLARRISSWPAAAVAEAKAAVLHADGPFEEGLEAESAGFARLVADSDVVDRLRESLVRGAQTPLMEGRIADLFAPVVRSADPEGDG